MVPLLRILDDTIKTPEEMARTTRLSAVGAIPWMAPALTASQRRASVCQPGSLEAEAYLLLWTTIQLASGNKPLRTALVASASPGEGRTTVVADLGATLARAGKKVLLVDADLRQPTLHLMFDLRDTRGVTNLLSDDSVTLDSCLMDADVENLRLLPSGPMPYNPAKLLDSARLRTVMEALRPQADVLLFDSPPILTATDAVLLASAVDGVILVAAAGTTRRAMAAQVRDVLQQAGAHLVGGVLSGCKAKVAARYHRDHCRNGSAAGRN